MIWLFLIVLNNLLKIIFLNIYFFNRGLMIDMKKINNGIFCVIMIKCLVFGFVCCVLKI